MRLPVRNKLHPPLPQTHTHTHTHPSRKKVKQSGHGAGSRQSSPQSCWHLVIKSLAGGAGVSCRPGQLALMPALTSWGTYLAGVERRTVTEFRSRLCESRGGRPGLPVLMSLMVSMAVKQHSTMHTHWSQFVPNIPTRHTRTLSSTSSST